MNEQNNKLVNSFKTICANNGLEITNGLFVKDEVVGVIEINKSLNRFSRWIDEGVLKEKRNEFVSKYKRGKYPRIAIILESPSYNEFKDKDNIHPALGNTGKRIYKFLPDLLNSYVPTFVYNDSKSIYDSKNDILDGIYEIVLINAIQFQCNQFSNKSTKDVLEIFLNKKSVFVNDFIKRLKGLNTEIIINASTIAIHSKIWKIIDGDSSFNDCIKIDTCHPSMWNRKCRFVNM